MCLCANRLCIKESKTKALLTSKKETVATSIQNSNETIPLLPSVTNLGAKMTTVGIRKSTHSAEYS